MLGICHAELYWADPAERTDEVLREAVAHLNTALMADEHASPTVEWADRSTCWRAACARPPSGRATPSRPARRSEPSAPRCVSWPAA